MKRWVLLFLVLLIAACTSPTNDNKVQAQIVEPTSGQVFAFGSKVTLRAGDASDQIEWHVGSGEIIGRGPIVSATFVPGLYEVNLIDRHKTCGKVTFTVLPPEFVARESARYAQTRAVQAIPLAPGDYSPAVINSSDNNLTFELLVPGLSSPMLRWAHQAVNKNERLLDWVPPRPTVLPPRGLKEKGTFAPRVDGLASVDEDSQSRRFTVPDPVDGGATIHTIDALPLYRNQDSVLWADASTSLSEIDRTSLVNAVERILPRCRTLFGDWFDTNGDRRIHILLTPVLNQGKVAVGFFNPSDVFPKEYATQRGLVSNGLNLLTIGVPEAESYRDSFSLSSLAATIAHELFHLILFERKSRPYYLAGSLFPPVEETFLDEGLAHLSESLNGYGISGGNIHFVQRYVDQPHRYSLSGRSTSGELDSVGRRGGMALLLSYLFWDLGGMDVRESGQEVDRGGIAFLRKIVDSRETGWNAISVALGGKPKSIFLAKWFESEMQKSWSETSLPLDLITKEPLGIELSSIPYRLADGSEVLLDQFGVVKDCQRTPMATNTVARLPPSGFSAWPMLSVEADTKQKNVPPGILSIWTMLPTDGR